MVHTPAGQSPAESARLPSPTTAHDDTMSHKQCSAEQEVVE